MLEIHCGIEAQARCLLRDRRRRWRRERPQGEERELCGDDPFKKKNLKDAVLRLVPYVTARDVKRDRK